MGENAERVRHVVDLFNEKKIAEVMDAYTDDLEVEAFGSVIGGSYRGKAGLGELLKKLSDATPGGMKLEVENILEQGDQVLVEWNARGILPSGKEAQSRAANVVEFRGEKISRHRLYTDTEQLARDLGRL